MQPEVAVRAGAVLGGRFKLERIAGSGGMGTVFFACDQLTGQAVAVKLLGTQDSSAHRDDAARFQREVQILAELQHPNIVGYVNHGIADNSRPYLVMEWLDGEELAQYLARQPLSIAQSLSVARQVAAGLAAAHRHAVVHRDIKPSNIFLVHSDPEQVKILDFGIARRGGVLGGQTRTGVLIGTPEYMAPEQARGQRDLTAAADVFSLGCVLYECLTGKPPFAGQHIAAVLAKILFEAPALPSSVRMWLPTAIDELLCQLLTKNPNERPRDAAQVLSLLDALEPVVGSWESQDSAVTIGAATTLRTPTEHSLVSVILAQPPVATLHSAQPIQPERTSVSQLRSYELLKMYGAQVDSLTDGTVVATIVSQGNLSANDQVAQAARCALVLREQHQDWAIAISTGRGLVSQSLPIGEALEQAAQLLREVTEDVAHDSLPAIQIDETSAGLLDGRFALRRLGSTQYLLDGERVSIDESRPLLGKPTPCIGRDPELSILDVHFSSCRDESTASAVLVTAAAGVGKSRLRHEFLRRLESRQEQVKVWLGRGEPLSAGSTCAILVQMLRRQVGILDVDCEPLAVQQEKLLAYLANRLPAASLQLAKSFLAELCGLHFPDDDSAPLRAARQDARLMSEQIAAAFIALIRAESATTPLLLVLEDLHWSDTQTVQLVDQALRECVDQPLMVLALARPEVTELFPRLWQERRRQDLRLDGLSRKPSERLVRQVLGKDAPAPVVVRIVEQAGGNALFLEELIRAVADGKGDELPATILAMMQSRVARLDSGARRLLLVASVFGTAFHYDGIVELLRHDYQRSDLESALDNLVQLEMLETQAGRRNSAGAQLDKQLSFRHGLMRDAAYSLLPEDRRRVYHRLAGRFLQKVGEQDPLVLAGHYERGDDTALAAPFFLLAGLRAHWGGDSAGAVKYATRGLDCQPTDEVRVGLLALLCQSHLWKNEWASSAVYAEQVLILAPIGSVSWGLAATAQIVHLGLRNRDRFLQTLDDIASARSDKEGVSALAFALAIGIYMLDSEAEFDLAQHFLSRLHALVDPVATQDTVARAWLQRAHIHREAWVHRSPATGYQFAVASRSSFLEAGHNRGALVATAFMGINAWYLGALEEALRALRETLAIGDALGLVSSLRTLAFVQVLLDFNDASKLDEAEECASKFAEASRGKSPLSQGRASFACAEVALRRGDSLKAASLLESARASLVEAPLDLLAVQVAQAEALLAMGQMAQALDTAKNAYESYVSRRALGFSGPRAELIFAETLIATGQVEQAKRIVEQSCSFLQAQSAALQPPWQPTQLLSYPVHARLFALRQRLGLALLM